jgi:hypothetical protein
MRDIATINAICLMIRHRQQMVNLLSKCSNQAELKTAIRRFCEDGQACFDQETENQVPEEDKRWCVPDWDALEVIVKTFCVSEK